MGQVWQRAAALNADQPVGAVFRAVLEAAGQFVIFRCTEERKVGGTAARERFLDGPAAGEGGFA